MSSKARWLIWIACVVVWTVMLTLPGRIIDSLPGQELVADWRFVFQKSLHASVYLLLAVLSGWLHIQSPYRWLMVVFLMAHPTLTEVVQLCVPNRDGTLRDVAIDQAGVIVGLLLTWKWWTDSPV